MHTICWQFFPLIYRPLGEWILSNIQPTLPFHKRAVVRTPNYDITIKSTNRAKSSALMAYQDEGFDISITVAIV